MTRSSIQSLAMLASLNISQWTARRYDKSVSVEVEKNHAAKGDAGRYNKLLIAKTALEPIEKIASAARQEHYKLTLAWGNNGERLLPGAIFMDFTATMKAHRTEFQKAVQILHVAYPQLVQESRLRLGTMYDPADYPSDIRDRYAFEVQFLPVPSADDFRVNLTADAMEFVRSEATKLVEDRVKDAVAQVYARAKEIITKIHEQTSIKDRKIFDSSIEKAREFADLLPALNFTGDSELRAIEQDIRALLIEPEKLRKSPTLRKATAAAAEEALKRFERS